MFLRSRNAAFQSHDSGRVTIEGCVSDEYHLQGVQRLILIFQSALTDQNIEIKFGLKVSQISQTELAEIWFVLKPNE